MRPGPSARIEADFRGASGLRRVEPDLHGGRRAAPRLSWGLDKSV